MKPKENDFYRDLDLYKRRGGYCGCASIAIFFIAVVVLAEIFVFSFSKNIKFSKTKEDVSLPTGVSTQLNRSDTESGSKQVFISQGVLCGLLTEVGRNGLDCTVSEEGVEIGGKIGYFLPSNSSILLFPAVNSGELGFEVKKTAIGKINVPSFISGSIAKVLAEVVVSRISEGKGVEFESATVSDGLMAVVYRTID